MTRHLAVEWGPNNIRVNSLAPGPITGTEGYRRLGKATRGSCLCLGGGLLVSVWGGPWWTTSATQLVGRVMWLGPLLLGNNCPVTQLARLFWGSSTSCILGTSQGTDFSVEWLLFVLSDAMM